MRRLCWYLAYHSTILSDGQAQHLASTLVHTLLFASRSSGIPTNQVPLVSKEQLDEIGRWNSTDLAQPTAKAIHQVISNQAAQRPDQRALRSWDGSLTYAQLDTISSKLAHHLHQLGVRPGIFVPVCFNKSLWAVVAMLAVNKTGGAFVPLDPSQPQGRLASIVKMLNSPIALVSAQNKGLLEEIISPRLAVSETTMSLLPDTRSDLLLDAEPLAPAYCLFTSGSTGKPKGCVVGHAALASVSSQCHSLYLEPTSRVLQFASYSFGVSLIEIWCTLAAGGTVCIPSGSDRVGRLADVVNAMEMNWAFLTPTVLATLQPDAVPGLRSILVAGEPLRRAQISQWAEHTRLFQAYGFTELAGICSVSPQIRSAADVGLIGKPVNARCWLTEQGNNGRLAPIGAIAELIVEAPSLAQGYLHDPERTTGSFIARPCWRTQYGQGSGTRFYNTGDLVHYDSTGLLRYVGRRDRQVKIRGQRIELAEVEYQIAHACPVFGDVVVDVVVPRDGDGVANLVAFIPSPRAHASSIEVVKDSGCLFMAADEAFAPTVRQATRVLEENLPDYMVPRFFVLVNELPMTLTGKVNRQKLRKEAQKLRRDELVSLAGIATPILPPATPYEKIVHQLVVKLLRLPPGMVGMDHDFLSLGGDSVSAMKLVSEARRLGIILAVKDVFRLSRLADLAHNAAALDKKSTLPIQPFSLIDAQRSILISTASTECQVEAARIEDIYPCTPLQAGMMALSATKPGAYIARFVYRLHQHVDPARLRSAWERTVAATPILRTRIVLGPDGRMYQIVIREDFHWDDDDGTDWDTYMRERQPRQMSPGGPLVYGALLKQATDPSSFLVVTKHHAVCDRWSSALVMDRVEEAYAGKRLTTSHVSPFLYYLGQVSGAEEYWKSQFTDLRAEIFPSLPSPDYTPTPTETINLSIEFKEAAPVGYTISNIIRLAWAIVVSNYTGTVDAVFGVTVSGRGAPVADIVHMVAPTVATVPLRVQLNPRHTVLEALTAVQKQSSEMIPFEQMGLQLIRKLSREAEDACSFQSQLVIQPSWGDETHSLVTTCEAGPAVAGGFASYALSVICSLAGSKRVDVSTEFDPSVIEVPMMEMIMKHFEHILQYLVEFPQSLLADVPRISPTDMDQLRRWNSLIPPGCDRCVQEIIQQRCDTSPTSTAIWAWDGKLTYSELHDLSERLAAQLVIHGVKPEVIVPICLEKSLWTTVAMLGVIRAGGAFVLLDPSQPKQRLELICRQIDASLILTAEKHRTLATQLASHVLFLDNEHSHGWPERRAAPRIVTVSPDSALYVAFTSGSTGTPKGVVVEHRSFSSSALALNARTHLTSHSRILQFAGYSFDGSIMETLSALMAGACLCVPSEFQRQNGLSEAAQEFNLTHAHLTPSLARHILRPYPKFTETLVSVGEPLTVSDVADWAGNGPCRVMVGYGPAECAVATTLQPHIGPGSQAQNIGFPLAGVCWVVHPENHDSLQPIGAVGELLIEGTTVARGYLNQPDKSAAAFIPPPAWMRAVRPDKPQGRLYKTGDLVRYNPDGSLQYVGRSDSQVKLRGQRIELADVEKHVNQSWPGAIDVAVEMVSFSPSTQALVAFVVTENAGMAFDDPLLPFSQEFEAQVRTAQTQLRDTIPAFMIPETFLHLRALPRSQAGKRDRRRLRELALGSSRAQMAKCRAAAAISKRGPDSNKQQLMQAIWAQVLNLPPTDIGVDDSFYQLGGDSISAMQVVAQARFAGMPLSVDEILRFKTISQILVRAASVMAPVMDATEELDTLFALSPIQQMFFDQQTKSWNRFNQTFLLRVTQPIHIKQLELALHALLSKHAMLRARFSREQDGVWRQVVTSDVNESCHCRRHRLASRTQLDKVISVSAQSIDVGKGPVVVVDLVDIANDGTQYLLIVIHHLVVDLVSWRVILTDLEAIFKGNFMAENKSLSFQKWCRAQADHSERYLTPKAALPVRLPESYHEDPTVFWGITKSSNSFGDTVLKTFVFDEQTTRQLLGPANAAFGTHPVEILHAVLLHSFMQAFPSRSLPLSFSEGHGREPWDPAIDLSQTVGWFTTLWPVVVELENGCDLLEVVRCVKDARRAVPSRGWSYFASRYLNPDGRTAFEHPHAVELIFNYAGSYQQFEHADSLFVLDSHEHQGALDVGDDIQRFGIFEIFASVLRGRLQFQFLYSRHMQHQDNIQKWIQTCQRTLATVAHTFVGLDRHYTLSDFPLLPLTLPQLQELLDMTLPALGISMLNIEDIYPCSPCQRGMLIAQARKANNYNARVAWRIRSRAESVSPDLLRLRAAWCKVVKRHAALRTVFVNSPSPESYMDQVVLQHVSPQVVFTKASASNPHRAFQDSDSASWSSGQLVHRMQLCGVDNGDVLCRLDISHTIMDRTTLTIIQRDLALAYDGKLPDGRGPLYKDYVSYLSGQDFEVAAEYWRRHLKGVEPCQFPRLNSTHTHGVDEWGHEYRTLQSHTTLEKFCQTHSVTSWNVAGLAWALVLRSFTNSDNICFGYVKSGRDLPIHEIENVVGPVFNPLPCHIQLRGDATVKETVHQLQEEHLQSLEHQSIPLSDVHRIAGVTNGVLFNTSVAVQSTFTQAEEAERTLEFTTLEMEDGLEVRQVQDDDLTCVKTNPSHAG
jgi:amino acid adenylation domain-containing protein/non-ribosomal peptide synthase protein (TIGR01720 family)